jgi:hypothetical protein
MQTSASSPKLYYVKINYHTPLNLPISIDSPQNITYNNGTILLKITADSSSIWFYNGTGNETYTAEMNRTFTEGNHAITAWTTDSYGNVNSTSVTFSVWFPRNYYRLANNACSAVSVILPLKTANDYANLTECQSHITTATTTTTTETTTQEECSPQWECEWGECIDGVQTETCTDISTCTIVAEAPPVRTQPCEGGIVTQQEVVETGSVVEEETTEKGFLGVVGSAIATPFAYVFNNRTRIFIFSGILLLVVVGFLVFKFSPQVRLRVLKLFNVRKRKPAMS